MPAIIDLSKPIEYRKIDPWWMRIRVKRQDHRAGGLQIRFAFGLPKKLFPRGFIGWANDKISMGVHSSTHIDAPWHYHPTSGGSPSKTIDRIPLEWCYGPGVVINMAHKADYELITIDDIKKDIKNSGVKIKPGTIVLIRTDRDQYINTRDYTLLGTGMSREATEWLVDRGVKVIGIDQWGFDLPLKWMAKEARRRNDPEFFWQSHLVGAKKEYLHIEQLVNLSALPPHGFTVAVFPLKIVGASAAPVRVVAIMDEGNRK
jgi:kynurenine formamidase